MLSIRPKVAEHALFVLGRSVHPELFQVFRSKSIERKNYQARIDITSDGHLFTITCDKVTLSEVVSAASQLLPVKRRMSAQLFRGKNVRLVETKRHVCYQTEFEIEQVAPEVFWMVQEQLGQSNREHELFQNFNPSGRMPIGAVSFIHFEARDRQLIVQALHTFPDDYQILKSFTTIAIQPQ